MSAAKSKGTAAETAVVNYLRSQGFETVERRAGNGTKDRGDIAGIAGFVCEVKNHKATDLAGWVAEAEAERLNDGAVVAVVWHKRRGKGSPEDWYVTMDGNNFMVLLRSFVGEK